VDDTASFRTALERLFMERAGWRNPENFGPTKLYHYTSSGAFLNIIESNELWFTDYRYQNDFSELSYGANLFTDELQTRAAGESDDELRSMFGEICKHFQATLAHTHMYVFSMCEQDNLLNQWRVYGRDAVPISIEFHTRSFLFRDWNPSSFEVVPMVYDSERHRAIANAILAAGREYANKNKSTISKDDITTKHLSKSLLPRA
jgi:hypothetical protein